MKPTTFIRSIIVSALVCSAAAACGAANGSDPAAATVGVAAAVWLTAAQLPDAASSAWVTAQQPAMVGQSKILEAISETDFPTAPTACRLPSAAVSKTTQDESDLFKQSTQPTNLLGDYPGGDGAAQFQLSYGTTGAAEQAAAQLTTAVEACAKSLHTTAGTNGGAHGKLSDPLGGSLALAAQLAQAEPQCTDVYVDSRCSIALTHPLTAGTALEANAVVTTQLPGAGAMAGGYMQSNSVYLVQRGNRVSMLFVDAALNWGANAADPTSVLQTMADNLGAVSP
jgi:hypothetical protein